MVQAATNDLVVNINGASDQINLPTWHPQAVHLDAGTYTVTPVNTSFAGALYTAYNFGGGYGWSPGYAIGMDSSHVAYYGTGHSYDDAATAFSHAVATGFSIAAPGDVYFGVPDSYWGDNSGGVSLHLVNVSAVPEVETYAMMLAGLGLLTRVVSRRKQPQADT